ncbi:MAG: GGDEF domain-containing protein [Oscillospiraceae bacterium]|nr:GGDEF domain-containing protein [Oscillospiraceae bacterium]
MSEKVPAQTPSEQNDIMQSVQGMIGDLLRETVERMQRKEMDKQLGGAHDDDTSGSQAGPPATMDISDIKNFVSVMQKYIDSVKVMIAQLESGSNEPVSTDEQFLDGYMATADSVLEIAAFSMKDDLTGLSNRYGFDNRIMLEWNRAVREKSSLSLLIFGVDGFEDQETGNNKQLRNNIYKAIAKTLDHSIKRSTDFTARWSDNEFAALLPITEYKGAMIVAERILSEIENMDTFGKGLSAYVGVNIRTPDSKEELASFTSNTYNAYQKAKESGKNMVTLEC